VRVPQIYKTLGQSITALRRKSNMTQQQLADAVGISRASVANIERGEQRVFLDQAVAIASMFDLNGLDELMSAAHAEPLSATELKLSGDRLNRAQRREVSELLEELLAENEEA
jgi:DNA-binding XRE family transcriptional regulator